jgi:acetyltransferase
VVFKIAPVTTVEAREMLSSLKMTPLLKGVRGEAGVDEQALIEIIQRLSQLVTELPMIEELDLNPVVALEDQALVVDARMSI